MRRELHGLSVERIKELVQAYQRRRKPPESGIPAMAVPPRGPLPKQGGTKAPLEFD